MRQEAIRSIPILAAGVILVLTLALLASPATAAIDIEITMDKTLQSADLTLEEDVTLPISGNITIDSDLPGTYTLSIRAGNWVSSINPETINVFLGQSRFNFSGRVQVPKDANEGDYNIDVALEAYNADGTSMAIVETGRTVIRTVLNRVSIEPVTESIRAEPGDVVSLSFILKNAGSVADIFDLSISEPTPAQGMDSGWETTLSQPSSSMEAQGITNIQITARVPENISAGDYVLTFTASSRGHALSGTSQSVTIHVATPESGASGILGGELLILLSCVVVGFALTAYFAGTETGLWALMTFLAIPLYSRISGKKVLSHFTRGQIYGYIQANPGANYMALLNNLNLANGVLAYHLKVLIREELVMTFKDGFNRRFYPKDSPQARKKVYLSRIQKDILNEIAGSPGVTQSEIAKLIGESKQVVNYHIKALTNSGLVRMEKHGKEMWCYSKKDTEAALLEPSDEPQAEMGGLKRAEISNQ